MARGKLRGKGKTENWDLTLEHGLDQSIGGTIEHTSKLSILKGWHFDPIANILHYKSDAIFTP